MKNNVFFKLLKASTKREQYMTFGSVSKAYYRRPSSSALSLDAFTSYTPSVVSQMEARLKKSEDELQATREELRATREEQKQQTDLIKGLLARFEGSSSLPPEPLALRMFELMVVFWD